MCYNSLCVIINSFSCCLIVIYVLSLEILIKRRIQIEEHRVL
nr:MAG TPA: hypothetical protein [Bacteriophage sp.]